MGLGFAVGTRDYLSTLAPKPKARIRVALRLIDEDPRHEKLVLKQLRILRKRPFYRCRVGDYRIVYEIRPGTTFIWRIFHRSEGYNWLERLDPDN